SQAPLVPCLRRPTDNSDEMRMTIFTDPIDARNTMRGLSSDELRALSKNSEIPNSWGIAVYHTRVRSRSAKHTHVVTEIDAEHEQRLRRVREYLRGQDLVLAERDIAQNPAGRFRTHYYVPQEPAQPAHVLFR